MRTLPVLAMILFAAACKQEVDTSVPANEGWEGHAWGTDQAKTVEAFKLHNGKKTENGPRTFIKSGDIRKLGDAGMNVDFCFVGGKFAGVSLTGREYAKADDARAALTAWMGNPVGDKWSTGPVHAQLSEKGDAFVVLIVHRDYFR